MTLLLQRFRTWRQQRSIAFKLVSGFFLVTVLAMLTTLLVIGLLMRARMFRSRDVELGQRALIFQSIVQEQERLLAREAMTDANLDGLSAALGQRDVAQIKRVLIPAMFSHNLNALYVILPDRSVLLYLGDPIGNRGEVGKLPIVENGFDSVPGTAPVEMSDSLWFTAAAPHRSPHGEIDAVILVGKELDRDYFQSLAAMLGSQVALEFQDTAIYSFDVKPEELSLEHLRSSRNELADYKENYMAFHSMEIAHTPYRVVAFDLATRNAGLIHAYLFQPSAWQIESMWIAAAQVIVIGLVIMLAGSVFSYFYARTVTRPLRQLTRATHAAALGDFEHPLSIANQDEVGQLARTFATMRAEIATMLQAQQKWSTELEDKVRAKTAELHRLLDERNQLLRQMISAQEEERRRIARELHDETSQSLTALIATVGALQAQAPLQVHPRLGELRALLVHSLQEVNRIVLDLRPTLLDDLGLVPALEWYADKRLASTGVQVQITTQGIPVRLPPALETTLFRVGQEALTNAAKYSRASRVSVQVAFENNTQPLVVKLTVQDNGKGFDPAKLNSRGSTDRLSLGLLGMQERIQLVGGQLKIQSKLDEGTLICASVPVIHSETEGAILSP